jgi:type IV pilus assembly protein PilC
MLNYKYTAKNSQTGQNIKSTVQAENEQAAAKVIQAQGLVPIKIQAATDGKFGLFKRISTKEKVLFSRQLSTLINAGLPLVQSLRQVSLQTTNKQFQAVINQVISDVEAGTSFSDALAKHPTVFNRVYISLVGAGEASGTLDAALERLADQQEKDADITSKVRGAMMGAVVVFMLVKVLPQVQTIYNSLPGVQLPLPTKIMLGVSHILIHFWWMVVIALVIIAIFGSRWARTMGGRSIIDKVKMKAWPAGPLFMKMYMARFARTGTTLVASGVPLLQMMAITGEAVDNVHIEAALRRAADKVKGGKALSEAIGGDSNFLELVPNMLRIGEQSGALETMLDKVADYYEKEVDNEIKAISTIIEPVMMVIMGIIAITIVAAVLLPIYGLVNQSGFTNSV